MLTSIRGKTLFKQEHHMTHQNHIMVTLRRDLNIESPTASLAHCRSEEDGMSRNGATALCNGDTTAGGMPT